MSEKRVIYIFKGDDTDFNNNTLVTININTEIDLTDFKATLCLGGNRIEFNDLTEPLVVNYSSLQTSQLNLGYIDGTFRIYDTQNRVKTVARIPFFVTNKISQIQNQNTEDIDIYDSEDFEIICSLLSLDHSQLTNRDLPDQHPIEAITGLREELNEIKENEDKYFVFTQGASSDIWTIEHNLNKYPSVTVVDEYNRVWSGDIEYIDLNNLQITFNASFKGKAYLN